MNNSEPTDDNSAASNDPAIAKPASINRFMRLPTEPVSDSNEGLQRGEGDAASGSPFPRRTNVKEDSLVLAKAAAQVALNNKGSDVTILDVCDQTALFDYFVLATGTSRRQLHAISEEIDDVLQKELKDQRLGIEGYEDSRWIVLDYGSVVIHLFDEETRLYYDLESLWGDAKVISLSDLGLNDSSSTSH